MTFLPSLRSWYLKLPKMAKGQVLFYACIWAVHLYAVVKGWVPKKFSLGWVSFYGKLVNGKRILRFWFIVWDEDTKYSAKDGNNSTTQ